MSPHSLVTRRTVLKIGGLAAAGIMAPAVLRQTYAQQDGTLSVTIANSAGNVSQTFQELIRSQGYFDQLKLKGTHVNVADGSKIIPSLLNGESDISIIGGI